MSDPLCNKGLTENLSLVEFAKLDTVRNKQWAHLRPASHRHRVFVGITEEYDRSLRLFQDLLCPDLEAAPQLKNQNPDRPGGLCSLAPGEREQILKFNQLDAMVCIEGIHPLGCYALKQESDGSLILLS
jgi:hypothetical protein